MLQVRVTLLLIKGCAVPGTTDIAVNGSGEKKVFPNDKNPFKYKMFMHSIYCLSSAHTTGIFNSYNQKVYIIPKTARFHLVLLLKPVAFVAVQVYSPLWFNAIDEI